MHVQSWKVRCGCNWRMCLRLLIGSNISYVDTAGIDHLLFLGSLHPQLLGRAVEDLKHFVTSSGYNDTVVRFLPAYAAADHTMQFLLLDHSKCSKQPSGQRRSNCRSTH